MPPMPIDSHRFVTFIQTEPGARTRIALSFKRLPEQPGCQTEEYPTEKIACRELLELLKKAKSYFAYDSESLLASTLLQGYAELEIDPDAFLKIHLIEEEDKYKSYTAKQVIYDHVCSIHCCHIVLGQ